MSLMPVISSVELLAQDVRKTQCPNGLSTLLKAQSQLSAVLLLASNESESQDMRKLNNFLKSYATGQNSPMNHEKTRLYLPFMCGFDLFSLHHFA